MPTIRAMSAIGLVTPIATSAPVESPEEVEEIGMNASMEVLIAVEAIMEAGIPTDVLVVVEVDLVISSSN
jgi:hypothetical protein